MSAPLVVFLLGDCDPYLDAAAVMGYGAQVAAFNWSSLFTEALASWLVARTMIQTQAAFSQHFVVLNLNSVISKWSKRQVSAPHVHCAALELIQEKASSMGDGSGAESNRSLHVLPTRYSFLIVFIKTKTKKHFVFLVSF